jgi:hypothetical protein
VLPQADELRVGAEPVGVDAEDLVTDRELADRCAGRFDLSGQLGAEDAVARSQQTAEGATKNGLGRRNPQSVRMTVVAWTLTRTSSSLCTGRSTSSSRRTSGGPYLSWTTALIASSALDLTQAVAQQFQERRFRDRPVRGVQRTVPFERSNPASAARAASIASGLNGNTLRWCLLALRPRSGRFLYLNAGIP